jgi:hypothetical protein
VEVHEEEWKRSNGQFEACENLTVFHTVKVEVAMSAKHDLLLAGMPQRLAIQGAQEQLKASLKQLFGTED